MSDGEVAAAFKSAAKDVGEAGEQAANKLAGLGEETVERVEQAVGKSLATESDVEGSMREIDRGMGTGTEPSPVADAPSPSGGGRGTQPSSAFENPAGVPRPSADTGQIGKLDESQVTRDENGLITHVQDAPVRDYAKRLGTERADAYRAAKADKSLPRSRQGNSMSVGIDRRTGNVYEGVNGPADDVVRPQYVHPTIQENIAAMKAKGPFPHPDQPLGHGEVKTTNQALWDRRAQDLPDGHDALSEIIQAPQFQFIGGGGPAPFCANCDGTLAGVESATGRHIAYPPSDATLRP